MRASLATIHSIGYEVLTTEFNISLVRGLAAIGRAVEAHELLDLTIQGVEINGDALYMPELLRVKGNLLLGNSQLSHQAQACLWRSIETSRRQGARGWELRTATDLARAMASDHNFDGARTLLQPVLGAYVEGLDSTDIREARQLLEKMPV
jgi:predicted ATPase